MTGVAAARTSPARGRPRRWHCEILHLRRRNELIRIFRHRLGDGPNRKELIEAINQAMGGDWYMNANAAGGCLGLQLTDRSELDVRTIDAADATPAEKKQFYRDKKRKRDRLAKRERRRRNQSNGAAQRKCDQRREFVKALLRQAAERSSTHWSTIDEIAAAAHRAEAFIDLNPKAIRSRLHEVLDHLVAAGHIQQTTASGTRGLEVRLVRWKQAER